ncbi:hypothetical protein FIBSPDRAFT_965016 [Athelia psychrophila]|uniref:Uncharacterized protein n=1 Tax=Athelia psychrophila TaxID=1759441 RepID=A0A165X370_9AGAM|nr:hypothetical protein FIBSPDRAFT_965016 [Fibularhizoctonia sp. CBS 109695]
MGRTKPRRRTLTSSKLASPTTARATPSLIPAHSASVGRTNTALYVAVVYAPRKQHQYLSWIGTRCKAEDAATELPNASLPFGIGARIYRSMTLPMMIMRTTPAALTRNFEVHQVAEDSYACIRLQDQSLTSYILVDFFTNLTLVFPGLVTRPFHLIGESYTCKSNLNPKPYISQALFSMAHPLVNLKKLDIADSAMAGFAEYEATILSSLPLERPSRAARENDD